MSVERNKDMMSKVIAEAFSKGNYAVLPEIFDPNFIEHQFGLHAGIEGMQADIEFLRKAFPDFNLTEEEVIADGDKVWMRMTARGNITIKPIVNKRL